MKNFRQWMKEAKAEIPAEADYLRLFNKWQCREEKKGEWYFPFAKSESGNPLCLRINVKGSPGRRQYHIGSHFYECSYVNGRFGADIADRTIINASVLRQGEDSYQFFESIFPFARKEANFSRIAKAVADGSLKASVSWHDKKDKRT